MTPTAEKVGHPTDLEYIIAWVEELRGLAAPCQCECRDQVLSGIEVTLGFLNSANKRLSHTAQVGDTP